MCEADAHKALLIGGKQIFADSVRQIFSYIESQDDNAKVAFDSENVANAANIVLEKAPKAVKAAKSFGELKSLIEGWLGPS